MAPITNDEIDGVIRYVRVLPDTEAACTTGPGLYYDGTYVFPTTGSDAELKPVIAWIAVTYGAVDASKFSRVSNRVRSLYNRARKTVIEDILLVHGNAPSNAKYDVINDMGEALNLQLDTNAAVFQKASDVTVKLRNVGLEVADSVLYGRYLGLNKYYNATKHRSDLKFLAARDEINSLDGRIIACRYYDAVRSILAWYFSRHFGIGSDPELASPAYASYGVAL